MHRGGRSAARGPDRSRRLHRRRRGRATSNPAGAASGCIARRRAGGGAGARPGPGHAFRRRLRHRRHRHGDGAAAAVARGLEHVRPRRARPHTRTRHGGAVRAAGDGAPGCAGLLPVDRSVERRADADPLPVAQPVPARAAAAHRLGSDDRPLVPERAGAQAGARSNGLPRSSRTSAGCSSATTGSTTRRSTATSSPSHPDNVAAVAIRQLSPTQSVLAGGLPGPVDGSASSDRHGRPWMCAPDGAGLARQLSETGLL